MIWLQSYNKFDEVADYDHDSGGLHLFSRRDMGENSPRKTEGSFAFLSSVLFALYRHDERLFVRAGERCFPLSSDVTIDVRGSSANRCICIAECNVLQLTLTYEVEDKGIDRDPTPFLDDESFDFGLFISNISKNPDRMKVLLSS